MGPRFDRVSPGRCPGASIRGELRQELAGHIGTIEEALASQSQFILESQQLFVRRDELVELPR